MKLPRDLSGEELVKHLCKRWEYLKIHQVAVTSFFKPNIPRPTASRSRRTILSELEP